MTTLKFKETFPKYPEYSDAIIALRPGEPFSISQNDYKTLQWYGENKPLEQDIQVKLEELTNEYLKTVYRRNRYLEYPSVEEQLEMLYNDIKNDNLKEGTWIKSIDAIKVKYQKP